MQKLYYLYDSKSETYTAPMLHPARGQAIRSFSDAVNGGEGVISQHPEDFTLFEIGTFDPYTGDVQLYETKDSVANGVDLLLNETEAAIQNAAA